MPSVLATAPSTPAFVPTESQFLDLLRECVADTDPMTGEEIAVVTAWDVLDFEIIRHDEETGFARFAYLLESWA